MKNASINATFAISCTQREPKPKILLRWKLQQEKLSISNQHSPKNKGWYETSVQEAGYKSGHVVILEEEIHSILNRRNTEGTWDGILKLPQRRMGQITI